MFKKIFQFFKAIQSKAVKGVQSFFGLFDLRDAFVFTGITFVWFGVSKINEAYAWIIVGAALFYLGARSGNH